MPLTPVALGLGALLVVLAVALTWYWRSRRCKREKAAINAAWQRQLDAQQSDSRRLTEQRDKLVKQLDAMKTAVDQQTGRLRERDRKLQATEQARIEQQQEILGIRSSLEELLTERDELQKKTTQTVPATTSDSTLLAEKDRKIARLKRELGRWQDRVPPLVERYRVRDAEANELAALHAAAEARLADLERRLNTSESRVEPLTEESIKNLAASNDQYDDTLQFAQGLPAPTENAGARPDNLKRIKGIGPSIEKTLHRLGIVSFQQLANLSAAEVDRVAGELRGFRSRIERENWTGQAQQFLNDRSK